MKHQKKLVSLIDDNVGLSFVSVHL